MRISGEQTNIADILPDGLEALRRELSLKAVMRLIERTARWVDPDTFKYLPVWYPEYARNVLFYKADWSEPQMNRNRQTGVSIHKAEGNRYANEALTAALGLRKKDRPNWSCCHIWGVDDDRYQTNNSVVQDHRYFSCVANMVLLPTPLKAFTDVMPEVKLRLRVCALHLYEWSCDHEDVADLAAQVAQWDNWDDYPESWPRSSVREPAPGTVKLPQGTVEFSAQIKDWAGQRKVKIRDDLEKAGPHYPREKVQKVLDHWRITL
jgi:hypothetical protein